MLFLDAYFYQPRFEKITIYFQMRYLLQAENWYRRKESRQEYWDNKNLYPILPKNFLWSPEDVSNTSQKRCLLCDVFKTPQTQLKRTSIMWRFQDVSKVYLVSHCDFSRILHVKWFRAISIESLKYLIKYFRDCSKYSRNKTLFESSASLLIRSAMSISGLILPGVYLSSMICKEFHSFNKSPIVKAQYSEYYLLLLVIFMTGKTL